MSDTNQPKEQVRKRLLEQRTGISQAEFYGASADIIERLKQQPEYQSAHIIHCYVSMNERREVETQELIREMLRKSKQVVTPVTNIEDRTLTHFLLQSFDDLQENKWGVLEQEDGTKVDPGQLDLVIVPMVAADERCHRMGYGKGFYDRFLSQVDCFKIGLTYEQNVVEELPVDDYDVPMDKIITEERTIQSLINWYILRNKSVVQFVPTAVDQ
ncbi:MAG: 5-formyltetrahydrofolate cyclo-ligase [Fodinibius sp.]|nr:5-formyltetrahydrofolate cyclo-ligase [Fodinibius sp.]